MTHGPYIRRKVDFVPKVVCAVDDHALPCDDMNVLVLPEGIGLEALVSASNRYSSTLVVGAARDGKYMRGFVLRSGQNLIDYLKIGDDGRSTGTGTEPRLAIHESPTIALSVLICMDVEHDYRIKVRDALLRSDRPTKLLCVPADMDHSWFSSQPVEGFQGLNVALSNGTVTYKNSNERAKSMIAGPDGFWISRQLDRESIIANLP